MQTSEKLEALAGALASAQGEIEAAVKDRVNPHFKSKYADLTSVWDACRPALKTHGLSVLQEVTGNADTVMVSTRIMHKSGQWIECGPVSVPLGKKDAQGVGSAITYAKRYGLSAALGVVADDDDDGNAASQRPTNANAPAATAAAQDAGKVKAAPGVTAAKTWVREHMRELNGSEDGKHFLEQIREARTHWIRICAVYPGVWEGPEFSGLLWESKKLATIYQCQQDFDAYVKEVTTAAEEVKQPHMAAE